MTDQELLELKKEIVRLSRLKKEYLRKKLESMSPEEIAKMMDDAAKKRINV